MSKLYSIYLDLKKNNPNTFLLFKSGIFYIAIDKDAVLLSNLFGFKLTYFNDKIKKIGFPCNSINKYLDMFQTQNLSVKIIETEKNISFLPREYKEKEIITEIIKLINSIDIDNLSVKEAYDFIEELKNKVKEVMLP